MGNHRLRLAALMPLLVLAGACADDGREVRAPEDRPPRRMLDVEWAVDFEVGGTLEDSVFAYPADVASDSARIYVSDMYAHRVVAFDRTGTLLWAFGERGAGPGEFENPFEVRTDARGVVSVFDPNNARITRLTSTGDLIGSTSLSELETTPGGFVPYSTDAYLLAMPGDDDRPFWVVDTEGDVGRRMAHPRSDYSRLDRLSRQMWLGHDPRSAIWTAAFAIYDGFSIFSRDTSVVPVAWYAEEVPLTSVSRTEERDGDRTVRTTELNARPTLGALSVAFADSSIYMLFGGRTEDRTKLIDVFHARSGEYRYSMKLTRSATAMSVHGDTFTFLTTTPAPTLWQARPVARTSTGEEP